MWEIFDGRNILSIIVEKIGSYDEYPRFVQGSINFCKYIVISVLLLSIYSNILPNYSLYNLLSSSVKLLDQYN